MLFTYEEKIFSCFLLQLRGQNSPTSLPGLRACESFPGDHKEPTFTEDNKGLIGKFKGL